MMEDHKTAASQISTGGLLGRRFIRIPALWPFTAVRGEEKLVPFHLK